jgi:hypothetical protein
VSLIQTIWMIKRKRKMKIDTLIFHGYSRSSEKQPNKASSITSSKAHHRFLRQLLTAYISHLWVQAQL